MANFDAQVIELVGATYSTDQAALDQFITEGANEVINAMPRSVMERVAKETAVSSGSTSSEGHKILYVLRNDGTIDQPCRLIPAYKRGRAADADDMEAASATDPVYYIQGGTINVLPAGGSGNKLVSVPTYSASAIDASASSTIANFPNEYEYLVVLYAAIKSLQQVLNGIVLADASISYSAASLGNAVSSAQDVPTDSVAPTNADGATASGSDASAYSSPGVTTSGSNGELTDMANGTIGADADKIDFDKWWDITADYIESNEDTELAQVQIQKIRAYINSFRAEVQDAQNAMQATIEDARLSTQASVATASNQTSASVANARNDVQVAIDKMRLSTSASIEQMRQSTNVNIVNATKTMDALIQDYAALVTEKTNEYSWATAQQAKLQADYDRGIQIMRGS